ncbi:MAG: hypothetical protein PVJ01_03710 [Pseudomonadota bacterium]|jgi:hypothetical protein
MNASPADKILKTLEDLSRLESSMAAYYLACSERWKEQSSLWMDLALEEEHHENIIQNLSKVVRTHPEQFEQGLEAESTAVMSYIDNITEMTNDIRRGKVALDEALTFALGIEESILEGRFFEIIISKNRKYLSFMKAMDSDLASHRQRIMEEIEKSRDKR